MVDARDLKSLSITGCVGSIPTLGTIQFHPVSVGRPDAVFFFLVLSLFNIFNYVII